MSTESINIWPCPLVWSGSYWQGVRFGRKNIPSRQEFSEYVPNPMYTTIHMYVSEHYVYIGTLCIWTLCIFNIGTRGNVYKSSPISTCSTYKFQPIRVGIFIRLLLSVCFTWIYIGMKVIRFTMGPGRDIAAISVQGPFHPSIIHLENRIKVIRNVDLRSYWIPVCYRSFQTSLSHYFSQFSCPSQ